MAGPRTAAKMSFTDMYQQLERLEVEAWGRIDDGQETRDAYKAIQAAQIACMKASLIEGREAKQ